MMESVSRQTKSTQCALRSWALMFWSMISSSRGWLKSITRPVLRRIRLWISKWKRMWLLMRFRFLEWLTNENKNSSNHTKTTLRNDNSLRNQLFLNQIPKMEIKEKVQAWFNQKCLFWVQNRKAERIQRKSQQRRFSWTTRVKRKKMMMSIRISTSWYIRQSEILRLIIKSSSTTAKNVTSNSQAPTPGRKLMSKRLSKRPKRNWLFVNSSRNQ